MNKNGKFSWSAFGIIVGAIALVGLLGFLVWSVTSGQEPVQQTVIAQPGAAQPAATGQAVSTTAQCQVSQAYGYTAVDALQTGVSVPGTTYIKSGSLAPVTSLAAPNPGQLLSFWNSNASTLCPVVDLNSQILGVTGTLVNAPTAGATCGTANLQSRCYANGSVTLSVYTQPANTALTNGGGANNATSVVGTSNYNVYYTGTSKKAEMPFGGCVALEYPTNVTSLSFSGAGISSAMACPYTWTYSLHSTSNTYQAFAVPSGFDANGAADQKVMALQLTAASNAPKGTVYITFQPANYYVGNDGNFHIGIQKDANADTTLTTTGMASVFSFVTA